MLGLTGKAVVLSTVAPSFSYAVEKKWWRGQAGAIAGNVVGNTVGEKVLAKGGNAVDAAVAAALAACVSSPGNCGIGGYGGAATIAVDGGRKIVSVDFNSTAPAAARPDMYPLDATGRVKGKINFHGWLATGVPGTLAGLYLLAERHGTRPFGELLGPAIELAADGCHLERGLAVPYARMLNISPPKLGEKFRNAAQAKMLSKLAEENSVEAFYRGEMAREVADAFQKNGGLVTVADMEAYQAREVKPLEMEWNGMKIFTAPLTAGGLSVLQMISILKAMNWEDMGNRLARAHARLETLRLVWKDRVELLGDPEQAEVPVERLLSEKYAEELAARVKEAVKEKKPLPLQVEEILFNGTTNISAVDRQGNLAAITLTQGHTLGAGVAVESLGMVLGHGMSRFTPRPGHPNAPGPGKRPVHNMCPSVVARDGRAIVALGGTGGIRIPNGVFDVLMHYVGLGKTLEDAVAAPRLNCHGLMEFKTDDDYPSAEVKYFQKLGYKALKGPPAFVGAVSFNPKTKECDAAYR